MAGPVGYPDRGLSPAGGVWQGVTAHTGDRGVGDLGDRPDWPQAIVLIDITGRRSRRPWGRSASGLQGDGDEG